MPGPVSDLPDEFVAATTASLQTGREKLWRRVRNQKLRMPLTFRLSGCVALFALAAYLIGDYAAARFRAMVASSIS
jgi:hypothetical protein